MLGIRFFYYADKSTITEISKAPLGKIVLTFDHFDASKIIHSNFFIFK